MRMRKVKIRECAIIGRTYNLSSKMIIIFFRMISGAINNYTKAEDANSVFPSQNKDA